MFGGEFGAFRTRGMHFFNEDNRVYQKLAKVLEIRRKNIVLRRGRQYLRPISTPNDGIRFSLPEMGGTNAIDSALVRAFQRQGDAIGDQHRL
jgi:hypothetical protein